MILRLLGVAVIAAGLALYMAGPMWQRMWVQRHTPNVTTVGLVTPGQWSKIHIDTSSSLAGAIRFYRGGGTVPIGIIHADGTRWIDPALSEAERRRVERDMEGR